MMTEAALWHARALLEEALHLRMHGERAPGGNETWADWDLRAEGWLRGQGAGHGYLSTACYHESLAGGDPALHDACRQACKFCGAPCQCPQHPHESDSPPAVSQVGQARDMARMLLPLARVSRSFPTDLAARIKEDPALSWLRGEERPRGTWKGGS